ncbi:MAG TPA: hypothetical protein VFZ24_17700 [Longimicrobiales bacterium]
MPSSTASDVAPPLAGGTGVAAARAGHRIIGAALLALTLPPWYVLLRTPRTGHAGNNVVPQYELYADFMWSGILLMLPIALIGGLLGARLSPRSRAASRLPSPPAILLPVLLAVLATALTLGFSLQVLEGRPNLIDSLAQALHARFWAEGRLAGPASDGGGFRFVQNALFTERGWVSQYPPGHVALLALGFRAGAAVLVGPVLAGITVFFSALLARRLFPRDPATAMLGPALLAVSPFFIALAGAWMNHVTAAAAIVAGTYFLVRAWQERPAWALAAGALFGWSFATRPLATLAMAAAAALTAPALSERPVKFRAFAALNARAVAGALPFVIALLAYNAWFFGHPLRMGYDAALGPAMGLGFHQDPWGNYYGLREAFAYTSGDLLTLGVNLFESPLPSVPLIGLFLLCARHVSPAVRLLLAYAIGAVLANALYWHHGLFMGPRMLHEAAPAWVLLFAVAAVAIVRSVPPLRGRLAAHFSTRGAAVAAVFGSLAIGLTALAPQRLASYGGDWFEIMRTPAPRLESPALVFVHDAWTGRVAMTLAAAGYRLDQVETLVRQNSTCALHHFAVQTGGHERPAVLPAALDTVPRPDRLPLLVEIAPGDRIRAWPDEQLTPECSRQARSDRFGILDLAPLAWQGDLPLSTPRGALFVRDLGPERNAELIAAHPDRTPWLYAMTAGGAPRLLPYAEGMSLLWGTAR